MTRTTLNLDPSVLRELKRRAKNEDKSIGDVVSEMIAPVIAQREPAPKRPPFKWHSQRMGPAKIDLEDKDAVWKVLDER